MTKKAKKPGLLDATPTVSTDAPELPLAAWLNSLTLTAPFTLDDAKALQQMIKQRAPDALVEVYWTGGDSVPTKPLAIGVLTKVGDTVIVRIGDVERNIFVC